MSDGTCHAEGDAFETGAIVPREPWREPTHEEFNALTSGTGDGQAYVTIIRISDEIVAPLAALTNEPSPSYDAIYAHAASRITEDYGANDLVVHGVASHEPGLSSVTRDRESQRFIGLHLDSWDNNADREKSRYRLCINVGRQSRYFCYVNRTLWGIAQTDRSSMEIEGLTNRGRAFMRSYPKYPVIRLRIDPGEAYIAPTDNIIHDAATIGGRRDYTFTVRAVFPR